MYKHNKFLLPLDFGKLSKIGHNVSDWSHLQANDQDHPILMDQNSLAIAMVSSNKTIF